MKKLLFVLSLGITAAVQAQDNLTIHAEIPGLHPGDKVYWTRFSNDTKDSTVAAAGGFTFNMHINEGEGDTYLLQIAPKDGKDKDYGYNLLYLDQGNVSIKGPGPLFKDATLSGSQFVLDYNAFNDFVYKSAQLAPAKDLYKKANDLYAKKDTAALSAMQPDLNRMDSITRALCKQWVLDHPSSGISAFVIERNLSYSLSKEEQEKLLNGLTAAARNNIPAKAIAHSIEVDKLTGIGRSAPLFTQNDTMGKPVSLESFHGKYLLVDFWASWCHPCREENPNVVAAFNKFKDKGFTVLSVSLDQSTGRDKWLKAIHDDHLIWTHVSDLKYWNNAVAKQYDIRSIPSNLLLDPQGKILARDLHGGELDKKLSELLGAPAAQSASASSAAPSSAAQPASSAGGPFTLTGHLTGQPAGKLYLYYTGADGKRKKDSCVIKNGTFSFAGQIDEPQEAYIATRGKGKGSNEYNDFSFFIEPSVMNLQGNAEDLSKSTVTGSRSEEEYLELRSQYAPMEKEEEPLSLAYDKANRAYMAAVKANKLSEDQLSVMKDSVAAMHELFDPFEERRETITYRFFSTHPNSYVTASLLRGYAGMLTLDSLTMYYSAMSPVLQQGRAGKELARELVKLKAGSPGSMAQTFSTTDIKGGTLSLSDFKGKYVLLDFWASWCVPCRHGNPHLKELYTKYKDRGIEFIGISDDDGKPEAWHKAVEKDGLPWRHVLRGLNWDLINKGEDNPRDISEKFGIHSLPTKILIDRDGKIIGRYSSEEGPLDKQLAELFPG